MPGDIVAEIMKQSDREKLESYYGEKLKAYGDDTRSLGWTPGGRKVRFDTLAGDRIP